jgi:two-component system, sensor histidine kinase and response regulator
MSERQGTPNIINLGNVKWPLSFKIPLLGFLFSLVISLIIAFTFYIESYQLVSEKEMSKLSLEAEIIKPLFSKFYFQSAQDISFLSSTPPINGMIMSKKVNDEVLFSLWQQRLNSIFVGLLKTKPHYKRMSVITVDETNDVVVSAIRVSNKVVGITKSELAKNIQLINLNEMLTTKDKQLYFSSMSIDSSNNEMKPDSVKQSSFFVANPIIDPETGNIFGILAIEVDLLSYIDELKGSSLKEINFYIADEQGRFLYYPSKKVAYQKSANIMQEFPILNEYIENNIENSELYEFKKHNKSNGLAFYSKVSFDLVKLSRTLFSYIFKLNRRHVI